MRAYMKVAVIFFSFIRVSGKQCRFRTAFCVSLAGLLLLHVAPITTPLAVTALAVRNVNARTLVGDAPDEDTPDEDTPDEDALDLTEGRYEILPQEFAFDRSAVFWMGYPSVRWHSIEREVERQIHRIRAANGLKPLVELEELRFIGRIHAREATARGAFGHKSDIWGYVSDRARELYGWTPAQWFLPGAPFPPGYQVVDNFFSGGTTADGYVQWWMNSPPHRRAILWPHSRAMGMGIGGKGGMAYLVFAGIPEARFYNIMALQGKYAKLRDAKGPKDVKAVLDDIVSAKEGSSFIWMLPLLNDEDQAVRAAALEALSRLHQLVPAAKGILFGLVDNGTTSKHQDVVEGSLKALALITKEEYKTPKEWQDWWHANWQNFRTQ